MRNRDYYKMNQFNKDNNISLKMYFDTRMDSIEQATVIALESMDKRLESMNEFRNTLKDQAAKFITRDELNLIINRVEQDIKNLETAKTQMLTITSYEARHQDLEKQVEDLRLSRAQLEGKASQESVNSLSSRAQMGIVISGAAILMAVINFITRLSGN